MRAADDADVRVTVVSDRVAAALSDTITPQGLVAVVRTEAKTTVRDVVSQRPRLVVVLVAVNDPGNVGTVIRTADAAGADAVVLADGCVDPHNSKCIRASAGSIFNLPVVRGGSIRDVAQSLHDADMTVAATTLTADRDLYDEADALSGPTAWLFGNEAHGLADDVVAAADLAVRIPIHGQAESLNLAAAAAICLYTSARLQQPNAATT